MENERRDMNLPEELLYSKEHEWIRLEVNLATIGITDFAQSELGDVVFVELPEIGRSLAAEGVLGSLESVKAVSEIYTPVSGQVTQVNRSLEDSPEKVNDDPYGNGWMIQIQVTDTSETGKLMSALDYAEYIQKGSQE